MDWLYKTPVFNWLWPTKEVSWSLTYMYESLVSDKGDATNQCRKDELIEINGLRTAE